jgi:hypothetical protein
MIEIWQPRWHDRKVLIAKYKVKEGSNEIIFTKAKSLKDSVYVVHSNIIKQYPLETNGKIPCYAVPLDAIVG